MSSRIVRRTRLVWAKRCTEKNRTAHGYVANKAMVWASMVLTGADFVHLDSLHNSCIERPALGGVKRRLQPWMFQRLFCCGSLGVIFVEQRLHEVLGFSADFSPCRAAERRLLGQNAFPNDGQRGGVGVALIVKRQVPRQQLVRHDPSTPKVRCCT